MFSLFAARTEGRIPRRAFLRAAAGLGAASFSTAEILARVDAFGGRATAKRCISIFLCGGPSQLDMWDPKPDAPEGIRSVFKPIETNVPGIRFTELIPRVAQHADKLAIVRSMTHTSPDHVVGIAHSLWGRPPAGPADVYTMPHDHPGLGSILHKLRGEAGLLPPWVILPRPFTTSSPPYKGQSAGFLGPAFDPVCLNEPKIDSLASKDLQVDAFALPDGVESKRFGSRLNLLRATDHDGVFGRPGPRWQASHEKASAMIESEACRRAFDLTREESGIRDRYGRNEYGQSFLLARRLVESGVRFVNVFWTYFDPKGCQFNLWDNHGVATDVCGVGGARTGLDMIRHEYCTPSFDRAFSALLEDLSARGLLDDTLVSVSGEFGRTPKINALSGRDHWPNAYSQILAGGGVRGGQVYGASDRHAAYVKDRPVSPEDYHATILHAFGVSPDTFVSDPLGRPVRVTEGSPLRDLF